MTTSAKREMVTQLQRDWSARAAKCSTKLSSGHAGAQTRSQASGLRDGLGGAMSKTFKGVRWPVCYCTQSTLSGAPGPGWAHVTSRRVITSPRMTGYLQCPRCRWLYGY
jgi:hypothetical protein